MPVTDYITAESQQTGVTVASGCKVSLAGCNQYAHSLGVYKDCQDGQVEMSIPRKVLYDPRSRDRHVFTRLAIRGRGSYQIGAHRGFLRDIQTTVPSKTLFSFRRYSQFSLFFRLDGEESFSA